MGEFNDGKFSITAHILMIFFKPVICPKAILHQQNFAEQKSCLNLSPSPTTALLLACWISCRAALFQPFLPKQDICSLWQQSVYTLNSLTVRCSANVYGFNPKLCAYNVVYQIVKQEWHTIVNDGEFLYCDRSGAEVSSFAFRFFCLYSKT